MLNNQSKFAVWKWEQAAAVFFLSRRAMRTLCMAVLSLSVLTGCDMSDPMIQEMEAAYAAASRVLDKMNAQHAFDANRAAASAFGLGVVRFDHLRQLRPGNDLLHFLQKLFFAGLLSVLFASGIGKSVLAHDCLARRNVWPIMHDHWN